VLTWSRETAANAVKKQKSAEVAITVLSIAGAVICLMLMNSG